MTTPAKLNEDPDNAHYSVISSPKRCFQSLAKIFFLVLLVAGGDSILGGRDVFAGSVMECRKIMERPDYSQEEKIAKRDTCIDQLQVPSETSVEIAERAKRAREEGKRAREETKKLKEEIKKLKEIGALLKGLR